MLPESLVVTVEHPSEDSHESVEFSNSAVSFQRLPQNP